MPAYAETYLMDAMENLGDMAHCATTLLQTPLEQFWPTFAASCVAREIAAGSPFAIEGRSGLELAVDVCEQGGIPFDEGDLRVRARGEDREGTAATPALESLSPAYWCGWVLGYYQWQRDRSFAEIDRLLPIATVMGMYRTFHEESEERFCEAADEIIAARTDACGLKRQRLLLGLSQSQLARRSGVGLRTIQQYEQGAKDIEKASFDRIERLAGALHCEPRLLLSPAPPRYEYAVVEVALPSPQ